MGPANEVKRCHLNYFSNDDRLTKLSAAHMSEMNVDQLKPFGFKRCHLKFLSNDDQLTKLSAAQLYSSIHLYSGDFKLIYGQA